MTYFLGIDPGVAGAVAVHRSGEEAQVFDIPVRREEMTGKKNPSGNPRTRNVYDLPEIADRLRQVIKEGQMWGGFMGGPVYAFCENTNAHPDQAVTAVWAQAQGIMLWPAIFAGMGIECKLVYSQRWKKELGLLKTDKGASLAMARELYPDLAGTHLKFKKDHNRAEALLIMEYAKRVTARGPTS